MVRPRLLAQHAPVVPSWCCSHSPGFQVPVHGWQGLGNILSEVNPQCTTSVHLCIHILWRNFSHPEFSLLRYGRFWLDAVAVVPFIYLIVIMASGTYTSGTPSWVIYISLIRLLRMLRIFSISKVRLILILLTAFYCQPEPSTRMGTNL